MWSTHKLPAGRVISPSYVVNVGDFLMAQGNLTEALKWNRDSLAIADSLAQSTDPENADRQRDLAISQDRVAILLAKQGDAPPALDMFR